MSSPRSPAPRVPVALQAAIVAGAPLVPEAVALAAEADEAAVWSALAWTSAAALVASARLIRRSPALGKTALLFGLLLSAVSLGPTLLGDPALALVAGLLLGGAALAFAPEERGPQARLRHGVGARRALLATVAAATLAWLAAALAEAAPGQAWLAVAFAQAAAIGAATRWAAWRRSSLPAAWLGVPGAALALGLVGLATGLSQLVSGLLALLLLGALTAAFTRAASGGAWWTALTEHPARFLVASFAWLGLVGGVGLALPMSAGSGEISLLDGLFTAVSATCVTGLAVLDTPTALSFAGQVWLVLLIQVGGLGISTFSTAAARLLGQRLALRHEGSMGDLLGVDSRGEIYGAARQVLAVTLALEAAGAALLSLAFLRQGDAPLDALWRGIFTSISAFCNAGFALQSDSLIPYQSDPLVLHTTGLLIATGGLGTVVLLCLPALLRGRPVSLHVKVAASATAALLLVPAVLIAAFEWNNPDTLGPMGLFDRLNNAWFQSVTLRTAGFNSLDLAAARPATLVLMMLCMFIGGSPGSMAGGVKTTTAVVLLLAVGAVLRGRPEATAFGRLIPHGVVYRAAAIVTLGLGAALCAVTALLLTQDMPLDMAFFEVISALGTVGLSIGGTARVDEVGKIILMICMFAGRVGPLSLFLLLVDEQAAPPWRRPEEPLPVG